MTLPQQIEPNIPNNFGTQNYVSLQLFSLVLNTTRTRNELERPWENLAQQEELIDRIIYARQHN